jgi:hypothetical protein
MTLLWACSGPGAGAAIAWIIRFANWNAIGAAAALEIVLAIHFLILRRPVYPIACGALFVLHPAWTISARKGDCGILLANAAGLVSFIVGGLLLVQIGHAVANAIRKFRAGSTPAAPA